MKEIKQARTGRTRIGEDRGKDRRTRSFSMRAFTGALSVERGPCPRCGHHKHFSYVNKSRKKCSRCGVWYV